MEQLLLGLQALFLILLYLFIWRVIRGASRDLRVPQESFIMAPAQVAQANASCSRNVGGPARLVVISSSSVPIGSGHDVGPVPVTIGRSDENTITLDGDEYASGHHARIEAGRDGVWLHDLHSTNGTSVNGEPVEGRRRLHEGDLVRVGETELEVRAVRLGERAALTDAGRKRRRNEDSFVAEPPLFAVADGMGGAQAGEVASRLAAAAFREFHEADELDPEQRLEAIIQEANRRIFERAQTDTQASGMGTTVTASLVGEEQLSIGHVGDSRAYRIRGGALEQLTEDHSLVADLVRSGRLSPEEADLHPQRSVITRALGTDPEVDVDTFTVSIETDDVFLLCSDGLTTMVEDDRILAVVRGAKSLEHAARSLVKEANRRGGEDNVTVVLFRLEAGDALADTLARRERSRRFTPTSRTRFRASRRPPCGTRLRPRPSSRPRSEPAAGRRPTAPTRPRRASGPEVPASHVGSFGRSRSSRCSSSWRRPHSGVSPARTSSASRTTVRWPSTREFPGISPTTSISTAPNT